MAKTTPKMVFLCSACGNDFPKWSGQCPACGEWGTLGEFKVAPSARRTRRRVTAEATPLVEVLERGAGRRIPTGVSEFDRVLGGGFLAGSLVLLGGNPGVGKSTLALQLLAGFKDSALYVSAEESEDQIALRARRLGLSSRDLKLSSENQLEGILDQIELLHSQLAVVDSIQTIYSAALEALPGTVSQVRECGQQCLQAVKQRNMTILLIGHVTKEGVIAGPKMLEHMVDTVLYLEGDERYDQRIVRAVKNRFGPTSEVGLFQMQSEGLVEVTNPSELFLSERTTDASGTSVYPSLEGSRPILVEIQALVSRASFGTPQRNVTGLDYKRLAMLLAVLEKRLGLVMATQDVFVNLVGGLRIVDPAADLAVIAAVASSSQDKVIPGDVVLVGEVGLAGEVRSVGRLEDRVQEAQSLGFKRVIAPRANLERLKKRPTGITLEPVTTVRETFQRLF